MEAAECGAVALAMVLGHFGRWEPVAALRDACGVTRDGTTAGGIAAAAARYGLAVEARRVDAADARHLAMPLLAFWQNNHFLVIEGFSGERVHLNDPAYGHRTVNARTFAAGFSGIVLSFAPTPDFRRGGTRPGPMWVSRAALIVIAGLTLGLGLALTVPLMVLPAALRVVVDRMLVAGGTDWQTPAALALAGGGALVAVAEGLRRSLLAGLAGRLALRQGGRFVAHLLRLPMAFHTRRLGAEVALRARLVEQVADGVCGPLADAALGLGTVVAATAVLLATDARLALPGLLVAAADMALLFWLTRRLEAPARTLAADRGRLDGLAAQGLRLMEDVKATGGEDRLAGRLTGQHARVVNGRQRLGLGRLALDGLPAPMGVLAQAAVLVAGGAGVMDGSVSLGMLVSVQILTLVLLAPLERLARAGSRMQELTGALARLADVIAHPPGPPPAAPAIVRRKLAGALELDGIVFGYDRGDGDHSPPPLLDGFHLTIPPGGRVALVGATGSGKSTVARLACGLEQPWAGVVRIDGRPLADIPPDVLRGSLAVVEQSVVLFEGTIRENLSLWDPTVPEERLAAAARDAAIHDAIVARPLGYDAPVTEMGRNLSGGQRARLELARALAIDPTVLILDEATAALDPLSEAVVMDNLRRRGCTCLIVAHRLSTVRDCDEILVLDAGRVVERGRHAHLVAAGGPYSRLIAP
jgi:NHLM bacteriocin system ABC transporter peptidase/ATP-binding protein